MTQHEAGKQLEDQVAITREDVARAKNYLLQRDHSNTTTLADEWLSEQRLDVPKEINIDAADCAEKLTAIARSYSVRLALYQAVWELVATGELIPSHPAVQWRPGLSYRTSHMAGGIPLPNVACFYLPHIHRPPVVAGMATDPDIFLQGIDCKTLDAGIRVAIEQSLECFRRGLYMPATVMLAAAAEAAWIECGLAVAMKLGNTKLESMINDLYVSISKKVTDTYKVLEQPAGKALLKAAGRTITQVRDAEQWTTILRDRRNALHWGKAKSFIANHSETGSLLMGAPLNIGTLEAIRAAC